MVDSTGIQDIKVQQELIEIKADYVSQISKARRELADKEIEYSAKVVAASKVRYLCLSSYILTLKFWY